MKKLVLLFLGIILLSACGSKQPVLTIKPDSNVVINPQFSFLKETLADQKMDFMKFKNDFDYGGLIIATNSSAVSSSIGAGVSWSGVGIGLTNSIINNSPFFNSYVTPASYMWIPYFSEDGLDYKEYEKNLIDAIKKGMVLSGYTEDNISINTYWAWLLLSSEHDIYIALKKQMETSHGKKYTIDDTIFKIKIDTGYCHADLEGTPYQKCITGAYLYSLLGNKDLYRRYGLENVLMEMSKIKGQYIVDYSTNRVYFDGKIYDYIIKK